MNNIDMYNKGEKYVLSTTKRPKVIMEKGKGMYVWDLDGNKYLDFVGGWAVNCLGHSPEIIKNALIEQSEKLINSSPSYYNVEMIKFAELLINNSCFDKVFFLNGGAESNESAIKLARKYGKKYLNGASEIITIVNSFHGRTLATMSATGKIGWDIMYPPKINGFRHVPINCIKSMKDTITKNTCAVMLEPLQGEGGVNQLDTDYIKEIRNICKKEKILLIFDEVQTGIGRTGKLFDYENYGIEPDIMTLAKGLGGGYPISAMMTKESLNIFDVGELGGTFSSQSLGMAVGKAVVQEVINKKYYENAKNMGNYILSELNKLKNEFNLKNIRGKGLLIAFDLPYNTADIVNKAMINGLLLNSPQPQTIRLMPPLIIEKTHVDEMINILKSVLGSFKN